MEPNGTIPSIAAPLIESNNIKPSQHRWDPLFYFDRTQQDKTIFMLLVDEI